MNDDVTFLRSL